MHKKHLWVAGVAVIAAIVSHTMTAAQPDPQPMSFFVTSVGLGDGANLSGLEGVGGAGLFYCFAID